ncbi:MAG: glycoside hydrolase family 9 protein [Bacteroidia bacterium]
MSKRKWIVLVFFLTAIAGFTIWLLRFSENDTPLVVISDVRLNQVGFLTNATKTAVVRNAPAGLFFIVRKRDGVVVYSDSLLTSMRWEYSGELLRKADFTALTAPGEYYLEVPLAGRSPVFSIRDDVFDELHRQLLRSFYFQRASVEIREEYGGEWARKAGHSDDQVKIHPSAASSSRSAGTIIAAPGGWYDAGDYGKYVPTATYSTWMLLSLYGAFPQYYDSLSLNIPESGNVYPDILDECRWSLRWLLTMQDPGEGYVCHKLTTTRQPGKIMPHEDRATRLMIGKSTSATLSFAAVMALASRVLRPNDPQLADSCLRAALAAWQWGRSNPQVVFSNPPEIETGPCTDDYFEDEKSWAAAELWVATGADSFYRAGKFDQLTASDAPTRRNTGMLAWFALLDQKRQLPVAGDRSNIMKKLKTIADKITTHTHNQSAYGVPMGIADNDFVWGSNGNLASRGVLLMLMARQTGDSRYADAALAALDYVLGRNATGYCFVTGMGTVFPQHIHHRISEADGVVPPVPGLMAGGPQNELNRDACMYPGSMPATTYLDDFCSFTTNETAVNWNAPMARLSGELVQWYRLHSDKK